MNTISPITKLEGSIGIPDKWFDVHLVPAPSKGPINLGLIAAIILMGFGRLPTLPGITFIGEDRSCDWAGRIRHLSVNSNPKIVAPMAIARIHNQLPLSAKWFNNQRLNFTRAAESWREEGQRSRDFIDVRDFR